MDEAVGAPFLVGRSGAIDPEQTSATSRRFGYVRPSSGKCHGSISAIRTNAPCPLLCHIGSTLTHEIGRHESKHGEGV